MDIIQALFLGILQGFTEFFPVSSSGHLVLAKDIIGVEPSVFFDIMMHVATLLAIFAVFWRDIISLFKPPFKRLLLLAIASVPAVLAGFFLSDFLEGLFEGGQALPFMFLLTAALLTVTEIVSKRRKYTVGKPVGLKTAVIMGLSQAVAVVPGLSRSGTTISAGVLSGADREKAARFSFFMSIPIILGSAAYSIIKGGLDGALASVPIGAVIAGMAAAAITGFFAIKLMLKLISKSNFKWFALYLTVLFIVTFINYYIVRFF